MDASLGCAKSVQKWKSRRKSEIFLLQTSSDVFSVRDARQNILEEKRMPEIRIEDFRSLIQQKARQTWYKMPAHHRAWTDIEDLIQDGILVAHRISKLYQPERARFITYLYNALDNYYKNVLATRFYRKRSCADVLPLEAVEENLLAPSEVEQTVHAEECLERLLATASPELRERLVCWVFSTEALPHSGKRFKSARRELRKRSRALGFSDDDLRLLLLRRPYRHTTRFTDV